MPAIIVLEIKKTPKIKKFADECNQIMKVKKFGLVSNPNVPFIFYFNNEPNVPLVEINSLIKMIKAIPDYSQVVKTIRFSPNLRRG